jgi:hypothetical protein
MPCCTARGGRRFTRPAAEQTWSGKIADSACGAKHEEAAEARA